MTCRVTQEALANYKVHATSGRVVVFDTETTGISRDDEIVQLSEMRRRNLFRSAPRRRRPGGREAGARSMCAGN